MTTARDLCETLLDAKGAATRASNGGILIFRDEERGQLLGDADLTQIGHELTALRTAVEQATEQLKRLRCDHDFQRTGELDGSDADAERYVCSRCGEEVWE